jgi:hypothetical protein
VNTAYQVVPVDLASGSVVRQLVAPGNGITSFTVLEFPAGNVSFIRIGQNGQRVPVILGMEWTYDPCNGPEPDGLVWEQPAVGGGIATVIVFFGSGSVGLGT